MARFGLNDAENYGGEGLANFFTLDDDGDKAVVRFMYESLDDISGYAVHTVKNGDKEITINCLRTYEDSVDNCPLCKAGNFQRAKFYFSLYNETKQELQLWSRGKQIVGDLVKTLSQINGPICSGRVEITRHGEKGNKYTKYEFNLLGSDDTTLEDLIGEFGEPTDPVGILIKDYNFDELSNYVTNGTLPGMDNSNNVAYRNNNNNYNNSGNGDNTIRRRGYVPTRGNSNQVY